MQALPVAKKALPVAKRIACELYAIWGRLRTILAQQGQFAYELYARLSEPRTIRALWQPEERQPRKTAVSVREWRKAAH